MQWFWFLCLTAGAISDIKERKISCRLIMICALVGWIYAWKTDLAVHIPGLIIGGAILIASKLTQGAIGAGDGWFFVASAGYLVIEEEGILLISGLIVSWCWSIGLVLYRIWNKGNNRKDTLPFLACLWPAGIWLLIR